MSPRQFHSDQNLQDQEQWYDQQAEPREKAAQTSAVGTHGLVAQQTIALYRLG